MSEHRHTAFTFTIVASRALHALLSKHAGAARFAFNQGLRIVVEALNARHEQPERQTKIPWTGFDLINAFNQWKISADAGVVDGAPGLPWRSEIAAQVFEEAQVDLGRALKAFSDSKKGKRPGPRIRFPRFKKKRTSRHSFRLRNKGSALKACIRLGDCGPRTLTLPKIGTVELGESTRSLRRMLKSGRGRILFATVCRDVDRWKVRLVCEAAPLVWDRQGSSPTPVGIDRGLKTFAVVADAQTQIVETFQSPKPMSRHLRKIRRLNKRVSRRIKGSKNRQKAVHALARVHQRVRFVRQNFVHEVTKQLVKNHDVLVLEDLHVSGMLKNHHLARHIADSAWSEFGRCLRYKGAWYGAEVRVADRFAPSTKRCSKCCHVGDSLSLSEREFHCSECGHHADRDINAAANLAQWPYSFRNRSTQTVAEKHSETLNALQVSGQLWPSGESSAVKLPGSVGRGDLPQRPRRAVLAVNVNTL